MQGMFRGMEGMAILRTLATHPWLLAPRERLQALKPTLWWPAGQAPGLPLIRTEVTDAAPSTKNKNTSTALTFQSIPKMGGSLGW